MKYESRVRSLEFRVASLLISIIFFLFLTLHSALVTPAYAVTDPLSVPNNKFGIHIISASPDEASPAAELINSNGDWGYITFLIESKNRDQSRWQEFFNYLRKKHLIPIVRITTHLEGSYWKRPYDGEEQAWADFLNSLNWPVKNRYVIVYNEPNHGAEWGGTVDPASYAIALDKTITALKAKSEDFFILNAGFDASTPQKPPLYMDQVEFMKQMNQTVPGIFNKLDGWVSHSYPNPEFMGSPYGVGRGTIRTYLWEQQVLKSLGVTKNLPIFITETGWKHAEGINYNPFLPNAEKVAGYYKLAFEEAWNSKGIVAVTPFLLNYQQTPFDHFSFKRLDSEKKPHEELVANTDTFNQKHPEYYPQYEVLKDMAKEKGQPMQVNSAKLLKGEVYSSIVAGESYTIMLSFKNDGQSTWGGDQQIKLKAISGESDLGITEVLIPKELIVEPGSEHTFYIHLKAPQKGQFKVALQLYKGDKTFDSNPVEFTTEVKEPVILKVLSKLRWKESSAGEYLLRVSGAIGESTQAIVLDESGASAKIEAKYLLPDYKFNFTLEKPNYKSVTIQKELKTGENVLDFGTLQPELLPNIFNLPKLWELLPWSN